MSVVKLKTSLAQKIGNMAKLIFNYGSMNSGKSLILLAFAAKLRNKGIDYLTLKPSSDTRDGAFIFSRPLLEKHPCELWQPNTYYPDAYLLQFKYILVDEAQFLDEAQVDYLAGIVDRLGINVICYGLRTDFQTHLFPGSKRLFELADDLKEIEDFNAEGDKVIINARVRDGQIVSEGPQIEVGREDKYQTMTRKEYYSHFNH